MKTYNKHFNMKIIKDILGLIYPPYEECLSCGCQYNNKEPINLCPSCLRGIDFLKAPSCKQDGKPLFLTKKNIAREAVHTKKDPAFADIRFLALLSGTLETLLARLEIEGKQEIAELLAKLMTLSSLTLAEYKAIDFLLPFPIDNLEEEKSNYDINKLLTKEISKLSHLPLGELHKGVIYNITAGKRISKKRFAGVKGSPKRAIKNKRILLIAGYLGDGWTRNPQVKDLLSQEGYQVSILSLAKKIGSKAKV